MNNMPFNTNGYGNQNYNQPQQQNYGGGFTQQYNPPPPTITFALIDGRQAVDNFLVSTNVTAFLCDFTNMRMYVKERDANNILKPTRTFSISELIDQPQTQQPPQPNQTDEKFAVMQNEMNELKQMFQTFMTSHQQNQPQTNNQNYNKNKGGNK